MSPRVDSAGELQDSSWSNRRSSPAQADKPVNKPVLFQGIDDGLSDRFGRVRGLHQSLRAHIQVQFPPDGCRSIEQPVFEIDLTLLPDE